LKESKHLIVIAGPTAVGKTAIALQLAQHFNTGIVSADSRQCYIGMSIGTAQPNQQELDLVPHYFVNEYPVTKHITAADYETLALNHIEKIFETNHVAIVCGGTGLYIKALCEGLNEMPSIDVNIEKEARMLYEKNGLKKLQLAVQIEDNLFWEQAGEEQNNPHRLLRALTFIRSTGKSICAYRTGEKFKRPFEIHRFFVNCDREKLYQRINQRVDEMIKMGLVEEVKSLISFRNEKNLNTVGYQEFFEYMDGNCTLDEAIEKIKQHSRNYAKRQITWFKKDVEMIAIESNIDAASSIIRILQSRF
jgi:tRNA dimethylallyltransferase